MKEDFEKILDWLKQKTEDLQRIRDDSKYLKQINRYEWIVPLGSLNSVYFKNTICGSKSDLPDAEQNEYLQQKNKCEKAASGLLTCFTKSFVISEKHAFKDLLLMCESDEFKDPDVPYPICAYKVKKLASHIYDNNFYRFNPKP